MKKYNFKKEWPKVQKQLNEFSAEAMKVLKKGEKEIIRLSEEGKVRLDATASGLKKEHLLYLIGKEFVRSGPKTVKSAKLRKLLAELKNLEAQLKVLSRKIKATK